MTSTAISAQGTTVKIDDTTEGTADVVIANIFSFSGLDGEASEIDVTNLSSTAKEYRLGLKDFGSFSLEYHPDYDDDGQNALRAAGISGAVKTFLITLPNAKTITFQGFVKNADSVSGGLDAVLTSSASIKITGSVAVA